MKAYQFVVRDEVKVIKGEVLLSTSTLESMYREAKDAWENGSGFHIDDFYADRAHTLEAMIQKSREGKYIYIKTSRLKI